MEKNEFLDLIHDVVDCDYCEAVIYRKTGVTLARKILVLDFGCSFWFLFLIGFGSFGFGWAIWFFSGFQFSRHFGFGISSFFFRFWLCFNS